MDTTTVDLTRWWYPGIGNQNSIKKENLKWESNLYWRVLSWDFGDGSAGAGANPAYIYYNPGTYTVTLTAVNSGGSDIMTKTGCITVTSLPLRIAGTRPSYYSTLAAAYGAAGDADIIQGQDAVFTGNLNFNRNISVTLRGGYDSLFATNPGFTTISGSRTITAGAVTVENVVIK